ncbi:MAG: excinuclease ABC subunit UvrC [Candidatus Zixiibacteriota bacterium]
MEKKDKIKEKLKRIPNSAGIYLYRNERGKIIYIGKAKSLRKRVRSYFAKNHPDPKTRRLVSKIDDIDYIVVDSESEAFLLEANMVRKYRPRYNINLKDDKHFPYLKITKEDFPRILIVRRKEKDRAEYFGPYTDVGSMRKVYNTIVNHFAIRTCNHKLPLKNHRPCLYYDIGHCFAPCTGDIPPEEYNEIIDDVRLFLKGRRTRLLERMEKKMAEEADALHFERAAAFRDAIDAVENVLKPQKIDQGLKTRDIIGAALGKSMATFAVFRVREGAIINHHHMTASANEDTDLRQALEDFTSQFYTKFGDIPPEILMQRKPSNIEDLQSFLAETAGRKVKIITPKRGLTLGLLKLARQNARLELTEIMAQKGKHHLPFAVYNLQKELGLAKLPRRIEAFDISNIGEKSRVASMVKFIDGKPYKTGYRRFKIKTVKGQDDQACMHEVVKRRLSRIIEEDKRLPDLLLIDGGKTQLRAAIKAASELNLLDELEIISLAKKYEEIYHPQFEHTINLPKDSAAIRLLQRIRDEAHRFAITYHRMLRSKSAFKSVLEDIPGVGPKRRKLLLKSFKSVNDIKKAKPDIIQEKAGIPIKVAKQISEFFAIIIIAFLSFFNCASSPRYFADEFDPYNRNQEQRVQRAESKDEEKKDIKKAKKKEDKEKSEDLEYTENRPYIEEPPAEKPKSKESPTSPKEEKSDSKSKTAYTSNANTDRMLGTINYYLGTPYIYGGESSLGMDCSGFVMTVYDEALERELPRTVSQMIGRGNKISKNRMEMGDLIFFKMESSRADHVGIYIGSGKFAHASESRGVTISKLNDYYSKRVVMARRI